MSESYAWPTETYKWCHYSDEKAWSQGWGVFFSEEDTWHIRLHGEAEVFEEDDAVWHFVIDQAREGDLMALEALWFIKRESESEWLLLKIHAYQYMARIELDEVVARYTPTSQG